MEKIVEKIKNTCLDELCTYLSDEIRQLANVEYKLKTVFVLLHIIEECRIVLGRIDTSNFLDTFKKKINEVSEKSEIEKELLKQTFLQDVKIVEALDCKDNITTVLVTETKSKIEELESLLGKIVKQRDQLSLPELKKEQ